MTKKATTADTQSNNNDETDFVLKHRIVGAAFLLFFGALFLPWILGASNDVTEADVENSPLSKQIETELIKAAEKEKLENQDQVYISRITPVDKNKPKKTTKDKSKKTQDKNEVVVKSNVNKSETKKKSVKQKDSNEINANKVVKTAPKAVSKPQITTAKPKPKKAPVIVKPNKVDVGWMVSVGVFSDKKNVTSVLKDLKSKGFKPSTSAFQTSKGPATRVWLGPFAERVEAAKSKTALKEKTGEPGLIKVYP